MVNAAGVNWGLNTAHSPDLAVTEQTRGSGNAIECDIEIEISVEDPPSLVSEEDSTTSSSSVSLVSSDVIYTATAGTGHEANLTLSAAPSYVFWYVQGPSDSAPVLQYQDTSGSLTSQLSYSFPIGVSGVYVISVSGTSASGGSTITASYTVSVTVPSFSPSASYTLNGRTVSFTITTGAPIYGTYLYVSGTYIWHGMSGVIANTQTLNYTFPDTAAQGATYTMSLYVYPRVGNTYGESESVYNYVTLPRE